MSEVGDRLREEAERARSAKGGIHPEIETRTHAAALMYAAEVADEVLAPCKHEAYEEHGTWRRCTDCGHGWSSDNRQVGPPSLTLVLADPGAFTKRRFDLGPEQDEMEPLHVWQARALKETGLVT